jgi:hypothetical protein
MRAIQQVTWGFALVVLSGLTGCIVAPYPEGRSNHDGERYRREQRDHREDAREQRRDERYDERRH